MEAPRRSRLCYSTFATFPWQSLVSNSDKRQDSGTMPGSDEVSRTEKMTQFKLSDSAAVTNDSSHFLNPASSVDVTVIPTDLSF
jgi:hypothetical protein